MGLTALALSIALAAPADYRVDWHTIDGGGGESRGGRFTLRGTLAQPDADEVTLCSPDGGSACERPRFEVRGGHWTGGRQAVPSGDDIFSNGFEA